MVVKSSVNQPNIFLEPKSIKGFVKSHRGKKLIHETLFVLHLGLVQPEIMLLLLCNTGDPKRITYWAEITAPLISNERCVVCVDFVEDVAPLSMRLREEHDVKAGSFYGRGLSGYMIKMRF